MSSDRAWVEMWGRGKKVLSLMFIKKHDKYASTVRVDEDENRANEYTP